LVQFGVLRSKVQKEFLYGNLYSYKLSLSSTPTSREPSKKNEEEKVINHQ
jgi:hypothetical protein